MNFKNNRIMKLIKHNPETVLFDNLFDSFFRDEPLHWMQKKNSRSAMAVNIHEDEDAYHLEVLAPGYTKEDLKIEIEDNRLYLSAGREENKEAKEKNYTRREFRVQSFERSFDLPENGIDEDRVKARFQNGILELELPKLKKVENSTKKLISIK